MALKITLRSKEGAEVLLTELDLPKYPEVLTRAGLTYNLKRLTSDRRSAVYYEVDSYALEEPE